MSSQPQPPPPTPLTEAERIERLLARALAGDQQPVKMAVISLTKRSAVDWDVRVLEAILKGVPGTMELADLQTIVDSRDPMLKVSSAGMENLHIDQSWDVYRTLDCSHLRKLAKLELARRQDSPTAA